MLQAKRSKKFKKEYKKITQNNTRIDNILFEILDCILHAKELPNEFRVHRLQGVYRNCYECHLRPDVLLIYEIDKINDTVYLLRIGSHANLFG